MLSLIARRLPRERYEAVVALPDRPALAGTFAELEEAGIQTERLVNVGDAHPRAVPEFRALLARRRPDLVHFHLPFPGAGRWQLGAAWLARVPVIATEHDPFPVAGVKKLAKRLTLSWTRHTVVNSDWARELMLREYGLPLGRVTRIWNGIEPALFQGGTAIPEHRPHSLVLLTNATLHPRKGIATELEALRLIRDAFPDVLLLVFGSGDPAPLLSQARQLGVDEQVRFLGMPLELLADLYATCDMLVQPSLREAFGLAVVEAMAAGKPVVATEVGGHVDTVARGETGFLVPPADPAALAAAVLRLARDPGLRARMGAAGADRVAAHFTGARMAERTAALYDEVLKA